MPKKTKKEATEQEIIEMCVNCGMYSAFYTKGYKRFNIEKLGWCHEYRKVTDSHKHCESWRHDLIRKKITRKISLSELTNLANSISEIAQILREEQDEDQFNPINPSLFYKK